MVLAILLYISERWCLCESEVQELRSFHHDCVRTMCRISMWHVERYSITNRELLGRLGLQTMDTYARIIEKLMAVADKNRKCTNM